MAASLAVTGVGGLLAGAALVAGGLVILAQLVAGLALVPLTMATYLRLLPAAPWTDGRNDGGPGWGRDDGGPRFPDGPDTGTDWDRFERQFRDYVEDRELGPA